MDPKGIQIEETTDTDFNDIMEVEKQAFGHDKEAKLVASLLEDKSGGPIVSLLAFYKNEAIGHILFTKAVIEESNTPPLIYILAPLAVKPEHQKQGVGGMLINKGLRKLKEIGAEMVFVLGHKDYYPRFGFVPDAGTLGFPAPYPIPVQDADAWMVRSLTSKGLSKVRGKIKCANELNKPEHWTE